MGYVNGNNVEEWNYQMKNKFTSILSMAREMKAHKCKDKRFLPTDGDVDGRICVCYMCSGCKESFSIPITDVRIDDEDCDNLTKGLLKSCFNTSEGRRFFESACI